MFQRIRRIASSAGIIFLIAMGLRVAFLVHEARLIPANVLATVPFDNEAGNVAQSLAQGNGFCCLFRQPTGATAWLVPVYPLLLASIFKVFGIFTLPSFYAAALLNCLFSALACFPVFFIGNRVSGVRAAAGAAWIWALFPSGIVMPTEWIWDTSLSALLAVTLLWATLRFADSSCTRNAVAYGLLWGLSLLTNPALGALFPFLIGWVAFRHDRQRALHPTRLALAFVLMVALCLPWTIRNAVQFHRLIPLRSNFPFELWIGNNEIYDEHSREVTFITRFEQVRRYALLGESAFLAEKWQKARNFIRTHPTLTLCLWGRRVLATWLGTAAPEIDFLHPDSFLVAFLFAWNVVTLLGAILGMIRLYRARSCFLLPIAVFPLVFPLVYYLTQTSLRLRHPCDPILALLLVCALPLVSLASHSTAGNQPPA